MPGEIVDSKTYTIAALAVALGYRQTRTLERLLSEISCPVTRLGTKRVVSGHQFRLAVERSADGGIQGNQTVGADPT